MIEAKDWTVGGPRKCEQLASKLLPILVRQAHARQTMTYKQVAGELELPHHRPVQQALGAIAYSIQRLQKETKQDIPPLTALVVNQTTGIFGDGLMKGLPRHISEYLGPLRDYRNRPLDEKRDLFEVRLLKEIWRYREWDRVLEHFGLKPTDPAPNMKKLLTYVREMKGTGETEAHRQLKSYVARNPAKVGLPAGARAKIEEIFPSQDRADVWFEHGETVTVVEVKPAGAPDLEIQRGVFQCVKYRALLEAISNVGAKFNKWNVLLVLGGQMPRTAAGLAHILGVDYLCRLQRRLERPR